jgi:hypothetical protein
VGSLFKGLDAVSVGLSIFKYVAIFAAAFYAVHTWHRSQQLDDVQAALKQEKAARELEAQFAETVENMRTTVDDRMGQFRVDQEKRLRNVNKRILLNVPADNICFGVDTVDIINGLNVRNDPARDSKLPGSPGNFARTATGPVPADRTTTDQ